MLMILTVSQNIVYSCLGLSKQNKFNRTRVNSNEARIDNDNSAATSDEITGNRSLGANDKVVTRVLTFNGTIAGASQESQLIGREKVKYDIISLISSQDGQQQRVISVWGMGGIGKTVLVKEVYQSQELISCMFDKRACVTITRPFILEEFLKSLVMQLNTKSFLSTQDTEAYNKKESIDFWRGTGKTIESMRVEELINELTRLLERKRCLIVLDDLSSTMEWDLIIRVLPTLEDMSRIIVTTREENIAKHCSKKQENIMLKVLEDNDALDLFTKKR